MEASTPTPAPTMNPPIAWRDGRRSKKGIDYKTLKNQSLYTTVQAEADVVLSNDGVGPPPQIPDDTALIVQRKSPSKRMTTVPQDLDNQHRWLATSLSAMAQRLRDILKKSASTLAEKYAMVNVLKDDYKVIVAPLTLAAAGPHHLRMVLLAFASLPPHMADHLRRSRPLLNFEICEHSVGSFQPIFDDETNKVVSFIRIDPNRILGSTEDRLKDPIAFRQACSGRGSAITSNSFSPHVAAMDTFDELKVLDGLDTFTKPAPDPYRPMPETVVYIYEKLTADQRKARMAYGISVLRHELAHTRQATLSTVWPHQLTRIDARIRWELLNGRSTDDYRRTRGNSLNIKNTTYKDVNAVSVTAGTAILKHRSPGGKDADFENLKVLVKTYGGADVGADKQDVVKVVDVFKAIDTQFRGILGAFQASHESERSSIMNSYSTVFLDPQWIRQRAQLANLIPWFDSQGKAIAEETQDKLTRATLISDPLARGKDADNIVTAFQRLVDDQRSNVNFDKTQAFGLKEAIKTLAETGLQLVASTLYQRSAYVKMAENFVQSAALFFPSYQVLTSDYAGGRLSDGVASAQKYITQTAPEEMPASVRAALPKLEQDNSTAARKPRRGGVQIDPVPVAVAGGFLEGFLLEHDAEMSALAALAPKRFYDRFDKVQQKDVYDQFLNMASYQYSGAVTDTTVLGQLVANEDGFYPVSMP